jgi:hypothetical protein
VRFLPNKGASELDARTKTGMARIREPWSRQRQASCLVGHSLAGASHLRLSVFSLRFPTFGIFLYPFSSLALGVFLAPPEPRPVIGDFGHGSSFTLAWTGLDPPPVSSVPCARSLALGEIGTTKDRHLKANRLPDTHSLGFSSLDAISECSWVWSTPPTRDRSSDCSVLASPLVLIHQSGRGPVAVSCTVVTDA